MAGGCLPKRDADEGSDSCIHLGVRIEEGRKVDVELRNARKEPDASGDEVTEKRKRGPTGEAEDGGDRGDALVVIVAASRRRYARVPAGQPRMMQPSRSIGKEESPLRGRIVSGVTRNRHLSRERDPGGSKDADSVLGNEVRDTSVDEEAGVVDVGGYGDAAGGRAAASMVADPSVKGIASREEGGLKANGI